MNIDYEKLGEVAEYASLEHRAIITKWEIDGEVPPEMKERHYQKRWGFIAEAVIRESGLLEEVERLESLPIARQLREAEEREINLRMQINLLQLQLDTTQEESKALKAKVGRVEGLAEMWKMDASIPPRCRRSAFSASGALEMCSRQLTAALKGEQ